MKKSSLTTAVLAGLAGVVGFAGSAGAVSLNPNGTGQVLIYPYYTVQANQQTIISVVNSTDIGKAVKVRFLESYNSAEVLDFNLFLSPYDVWSGVVFDTGELAEGNVAGAFGTSDRSCTVPDIVTASNANVSVAPKTGLHYVTFSNSVYAADSGPAGLERTREGYVEMIWMADVTGDTLDAITHVAGVPNDCDSSLLRTNLSSNTDFIGSESGEGGLFGSGNIVNVKAGTLYSYNADTLDGFRYGANVTGSGDLDPNLGQAQGPGGADPQAHVFQGNTVINATYANGKDAVSAVFMAEAVMNEWAASGDAIGTDWVVTFPTKRFYVNGSAPTLNPFTKPFANGVSCVQIELGKNHLFDIEEGTPTVVGDDFSPVPEDVEPSSLCYEVNVLSFSNEDDAHSILGAANPMNVPVDNPDGWSATAGWLKLGLNPTGQPHALPASTEGTVFHGLPVTGFAATRYVSDALPGGVLANYAGAYHHRAERNVTSS